MIRLLIRWVISIVKRFVDDTVPEAELHTAMRRWLHTLSTAMQEGSIPLDSAYLPQLVACLDRLEALGFEGLQRLPVHATTHFRSESLRDTDAAGHIISKSMIRREVIDSLYMLVDQEQPLSETGRNHMEALLRHIEVRRKAGLRFDDVRSESDRWHEVARISVTLSRHARRAGDYRFLNTSLKLNDWAFPHFRGLRKPGDTTVFYLALLEAEAAVAELSA